ncbi:hypothetical protein BU23DRAFT_585195 [Bimuria novae-zelandiae CBS 107.79]|uniref:HTH CENPB-type domain-containing protein n=1 Tax=Bimuria novae-zelandiae CBS 107.79 TaxID=1447943 RepID=A0A6A5UVR4_9PLEO|nr:hypothetical protein BU23DRAFT_585195 [Bimuria novae-zelandiae CBS 107.79]
MAPIDDAIKDLKSRNLREHFTLRKVTKKYEVNCSTLGRRWRGLSDRWVSRFITRHQIYIILKWTTAIDRITEYHLKARDIYNMDEKGFLIGLIGRSKRIFSRPYYYADRSSLPLSLIYVAKKGAI